MEVMIILKLRSGLGNSRAKYLLFYTPFSGVPC